jgi:hypothetical protein
MGTNMKIVFFFFFLQQSDHRWIQPKEGEPLGCQWVGFMKIQNANLDLPLSVVVHRRVSFVSFVRKEASKLGSCRLPIRGRAGVGWDSNIHTGPVV